MNTSLHFDSLGCREIVSFVIKISIFCLVGFFLLSFFLSLSHVVIDNVYRVSNSHKPLFPSERWPSIDEGGGGETERERGGGAALVKFYKDPDIFSLIFFLIYFIRQNESTKLHLHRIFYTDYYRSKEQTRYSQDYVGEHNTIIK